MSAQTPLAGQLVPSSCERYRPENRRTQPMGDHAIVHASGKYLLSVYGATNREPVLVLPPLRRIGSLRSTPSTRRAAAAPLVTCTGVTSYRAPFIRPDPYRATQTSPTMALLAKSFLTRTTAPKQAETMCDGGQASPRFCHRRSMIQDARCIRVSVPISIRQGYSSGSLRA